MSKIIVRIKGGLGNQLFCYSAARRLSIANKAELVIDHVTGFKRDYQYQRKYALDQFAISARKATPDERMEPFERYRRRLAMYFSKKKPFYERTYIEQEKLDLDLRLLDYRVSERVYLDGYWQSEEYFKDVDQIIRSDLCIKPPVDPVNQEMATRILNNLSVAVHIRFFDELDEIDSNNAPNNYYVRAIEKMESFISGAHYFIFSDRPEAARARMPLSDKQITCISHNQRDENAYADLWLMTKCQHFIIANSTFSWWGAWLADYPEKRVIAPGFEKREGISWWGLDGLLPEQWLKI